MKSCFSFFPICLGARSKVTSIACFTTACLVALLFLLPPVRLYAQTLTGPASVDFSSANLCKAGGTTPAPCSTARTLTYNISGSGTLGATKVLTLASPNLDFTEMSGSTCTGAVTAGTTCTVHVNFAPRYPGTRPGAVIITDESGKTVVTTPIFGSGAGPQIGFDPGFFVELPYSLKNAAYTDLAIDGANDIYVYGYSTNEKGEDVKIHLEKLPAGGGAAINIPVSGGSLSTGGSIALDGAGNLFFNDGLSESGSIAEVPAGGGSQIEILTGAAGPTVDKMGNLYLPSYTNDAIPTYLNAELPFGCQSVNCALTFKPRGGEALVDTDGNLYYAKYSDQPVAGAGTLYKVPFAGGSSTELFSGQGHLTYVAVDNLGNVFLSSGGDNYELPVGSTSLIPVTVYGMVVNAAGDFFGVDYFPITHDYRVYQGLRSQAPSIDFGTIAFGGTNPVQSLVIANTGTGTLKVDPSFGTTNFRLAGQSPADCLNDVTPKQPCTVQVEFTPTAPGTSTDTLTLRTNALNDASVSIKGTAGEVTPPLFKAHDVETHDSVFAGPVEVKIYDSTPGTTIYYTTDGSVPTAASTKYVGSFVLFNTQRITAIAMVDGLRSRVVSTVFILPSGTSIDNGYFDYYTFLGAQNVMAFNGSTAQAGSALQLTNAPAEAGSAFIKFGLLPIQAFTSFFRFQVTPSTGNDLTRMADGFTFTIQNTGVDALGGAGQGLGYEGIQKSVGIKFDLHNNEGEGEDSVGVYVDGAVPTTPSASLAGSGVDLHSGDIMEAELGYDGTNLTVTLTDTINQATWSHTFPVAIQSAVGRHDAYLGFTGSTGGESANQQLLDWFYVPNAPGPQPPALAGPETPDYPVSILAPGITFNGSAAPFNTMLHLADGRPHETGSAFFSKPMNIKAFTNDFTFKLQPSPTSGFTKMADGLTFTIQNSSANALGGDGGYLGYGGIGKSVAIKFDLYSNDGEGADSTGLYVDGTPPTAPSIDLTGAGINLHSGNPFRAHMTYDGASLNLTLTDMMTKASWTHSFAIDIPATVGNDTAWVGFTGATGRETAIPQILTWTFTNP